ncbi:TIGR01440 family protein [Paenibacillus sp. UNCCL117]|uniref:TIGR01440 family protein n=1 Tax=unclassified Paenibacillus TaxID=185978 RepID=UPI0008865C7E|nr:MULTISPECIES: TIGR01440 family protein [unclassified Paenibacillus]SDE33503.1 TIGR01440 family protein [Paenibacillus sp. cl123]SFW64042.1 TIGR01440 family protein [Paenibacillus sp. UNCCL117]
MKEHPVSGGEPAAVDAQLIRERVQTMLRELASAGKLEHGQLLVIGTSTSEVLGRHIGTSGSEQVAAAIFEAVEAVRSEYGFYPVYQCCEHLNRALVLEQDAMRRYNLEQVSVVPVPKAGGSMAAYAYKHLPDAVVVETVQAHAGIDIGGTLIGMHLKRVAVPFKPSVRQIGEAYVQAALTRPKLIGGARAVYTAEQHQPPGSCD